MWYQPNYFLDDSEISSAAERSASIRGTVVRSIRTSHARRFNAGQSTQVVHEVHPSGTVALASSSALPQLSAEAVNGRVPRSSPHGVALRGDPLPQFLLALALGEDDNGASMKFEVKGHGMLAIEGLTPAGLPALRLVAFHSPDFQVACHNGTGIMRVCLKDIDLRPSLTAETPANMDRAQLSRLGSSQG